MKIQRPKFINENDDTVNRFMIRLVIFLWICVSAVAVLCAFQYGRYVEAKDLIINNGYRKTGDF